MTSRSPTRRPGSAAPAAKAAPSRRASVRPAARDERLREEPATPTERLREEPATPTERLREEPATPTERVGEEPAPVFRFKPGDRVRIREDIPDGHCRTPFYVRGKVGAVERCVGHFRNPEQLAYGRTGLPKAALYAVRFPQPELWIDYPGPGADTLVADLCDFWLDPA